jgi:hypothetical protein
MREIAQIAGAHEVGVGRRVKTARLGRLGIGEVWRAARRAPEGRMGILRVAEGRHERSGRSSSSRELRGCCGTARCRAVGAVVALGKGAQRVEVIMLGYDIQGRVLRNKVHSVHRAAVLARCGVLKDGGRHVESGGLACFSWDDRPLTSLPVNGTCLGLRLRLIGRCLGRAKIALIAVDACAWGEED